MLYSLVPSVAIGVGVAIGTTWVLREAEAPIFITIFGALTSAAFSALVAFLLLYSGPTPPTEYFENPMSVT